MNYPCYQKSLKKTYSYMSTWKICGFRKALSTQHAQFRLIQLWQKELDESGLVGTILRDLSKAMIVYYMT